MKEIDLLQAYYGAINLSYTASSWWLTISTALVVATYFAAKHIPGWLFAVSLALYLLTAASAIFEIVAYSKLAVHYGGSVVAMAPAWQVGAASGRVAGGLNTAVNYAFFVLGTISAAAFSFVTWRGARKAVASGEPGANIRAAEMALPVGQAGSA